jgi:hypothetical protein
MYNLLVQYMPREAGRGSVSVSRLFEYTDEELEAQFKDGDSILLENLARLPCFAHFSGCPNLFVKV